jgi:hypothetical protein
MGGGPNALSVKMYQYQLAMRRITDRMNWNRFVPVPYIDMTVRVEDGRELRFQAIISEDRARMIGWIFDSYGATAPVRAKASLSSLDRGTHKVAWYDDRTGAELQAENRKGPTVTTLSPAFLGHVVLMVSPAG